MAATMRSPKPSQARTTPTSAAISTPDSARKASQASQPPPRRSAMRPATTSSHSTTGVSSVISAASSRSLKRRREASRNGVASVAMPLTRAAASASRIAYSATLPPWLWAMTKCRSSAASGRRWR